MLLTILENFFNPRPRLQDDIELGLPNKDYAAVIEAQIRSGNRANEATQMLNALTSFVALEEPDIELGFGQPLSLPNLSNVVLTTTSPSDRILNTAPLQAQVSTNTAQNQHVESEHADKTKTLRSYSDQDFKSISFFKGNKEKNIPIVFTERNKSLLAKQEKFIGHNEHDVSNRLYLGIQQMCITGYNVAQNGDEESITRLQQKVIQAIKEIPPTGAFAVYALSNLLQKLIKTQNSETHFAAQQKFEKCQQKVLDVRAVDYEQATRESHDNVTKAYDELAFAETALTQANTNNTIAHLLILPLQQGITDYICTFITLLENNKHDTVTLKSFLKCFQWLNSIEGCDEIEALRKAVYNIPNIGMMLEEVDSITTSDQVVESAAPSASNKSAYTENREKLLHRFNKKAVQPKEIEKYTVNEQDKTAIKERLNALFAAKKDLLAKNKDTQTQSESNIAQTRSTLETFFLSKYAATETKIKGHSSDNKEPYNNLSGEFALHHIEEN